MRSPDPHRTKDDEEAIATWGLDLDKILCIFDVSRHSLDDDR